MQCPEKSRKNSPPIRRHGSHPSEIFLKGQMQFLIISSGCDDFGYGLQNRITCPVEGTPSGEIRIKAVAHHRNHITLAPQNGEFCCHCLDRGKLLFSSKGHDHRPRTDGSVEHLRQPFFRADIQIRERLQKRLLAIACLQGFFYLFRSDLVKIILLWIRKRHKHFLFLSGSVGIQKRPA